MAVRRNAKQYADDVAQAEAERFISAAGSADIMRTAAKHRKVPVALRFDQGLLDSIDSVALKRCMSRTQSFPTGALWHSKANSSR